MTVSKLLDELDELTRTVQHGSACEAFLRAGELECALTDVAHPASSLAADLTDALAGCYLGEADITGAQFLRRLRQQALPAQLTLKIPEGYAYYALSPAQYAELARRWARQTQAQHVAVIGVRSIGTSLSAAVSVTLRQEKLSAARLTVRPEGHPWDRQLTWAPAASRFVLEHARRGATFLVVDEGPGMSGSTFTAVAAALEHCGVSTTQIELFCSHLPDPAGLIAPSARARWPRYEKHAPPALPLPRDAVDFSAGMWRQHSYATAQLWPASWTQRERVKHWYPAEQRLVKFEGLPPYGNAALERARELARAGFAPAVSAGPDGFAHYTFIESRPARRTDLDQTALETLAGYCSHRVRAFAADGSNAALLDTMLRVNTHEALGVELGARWSLDVHTPIVVDGRMQPHEWRIDATGRWWKTDGHAHGDDHLLPGPTDVCWDLAGSIIEWNMSPAQAEHLITRYAALSGDRHVRARLPAFTAAYCALRCGEHHFALQAADDDERLRLSAASASHRSHLARAIAETEPHLTFFQQSNRGAMP